MTQRERADRRDRQWNRRHLLAGAGAAGLLALAGISSAQSNPRSTVPLSEDKLAPTRTLPTRSGDPPPTVDVTEAPPITATAVWVDKEAYTGSHLGVNVTWDHAVWRFSGDETTGAAGYADDEPAFPEEDVLLIESLAVHMVPIAQISFWPGGWASIAEAAVRGADAFAESFPLSEIETVGSWANDVAAGFLLRFSDYSQMYVEFTQPAPGIWSLLRYSASYNTVDDLVGTAESLVGAWIEGEPMVRAVGVDELVAAFEANV